MIEVKKGYVLVEERFKKKSSIVSLEDSEKGMGYNMEAKVLFAHEDSDLKAGDIPIYSKYAEAEYEETIKGKKNDQMIVNHCVYREDFIVAKKGAK